MPVGITLEDYSYDFDADVDYEDGMSMSDLNSEDEDDTAWACPPRLGKRARDDEDIDEVETPLRRRKIS